MYHFDDATAERAGKASEWFPANGGDMNIKDGAGMLVRFVTDCLKPVAPLLRLVLTQFEQD